MKSLQCQKRSILQKQEGLIPCKTDAEGVSAQRDTPLSPPLTSAEIYRRTCLHSNLQISPPTPKNAYAKFQNPKTTLGNYPPPPLLYHSAGVVGVPEICWDLEY